MISAAGIGLYHGYVRWGIVKAGFIKNSLK